jgi:hypothetical protein
MPTSSEGCPLCGLTLFEKCSGLCMWKMLDTITNNLYGSCNIFWGNFILASTPRRSKMISGLSTWCLDPSSVPVQVGAIIAMNIQQIEISGASGDPSRDLLPIIQCYNSGKMSSAPAMATLASTQVQKSNFNSNSNSSNNNNYNYNTKGCGMPAPCTCSSAFQPQSRQLCKYCQRIFHL